MALRLLQNQLVLWLTILSTSAFAQTQELDRIVAIVDQGVITLRELDERLDSIYQRFADDPSQLPPANELREQVLERLIAEELQLQMAARGGLQVPDAQIDQAFADLAMSNGMTPREFLDELSAMGESSLTKVVTNIRDEMTIQQLQQMQVSERIQITDAEVANFLESAEGRMWTAPELLIQNIFLPLPGNASPEQVNAAEATLSAIYNGLAQGADFENLAVQFSSGPNALEGGNLGWRRTIEFSPELAAAIDATNVGEVSAPVRGAGGIHIFNVVDSRSSSESGLVEQTKTRHILIRPNEIRSESEAADLIQLIYQKLQNGESFEDLARTYSGDIANALNGGDLGWVLPGQMVPQFEAAMNNTATGEFSPPLLTPFGWHVLMVEERRQVDMSNEIIEQQARNLIANQRFEEELDLWLREIRGEAFVRIID